MFRDRTPQPAVVLAADEMLKISADIVSRFAPGVAKPLADEVEIFGGIVDSFGHDKPAEESGDRLMHSRHDAHIGLTPQELLAISRDVGSWFQRNSDVSEREPELLLLPVDPTHLYAYWHLGTDKPPKTLPRAAMDGLTLRVYWQPDVNSGQTSSNVWFDVNIDKGAERQKVRLPIDDSNYSAALGKIGRNHQFHALVHSNVIRVPTAVVKAMPTSKPAAVGVAKQPLPDIASSGSADVDGGAKRLGHSNVVLASTGSLLQGHEALQRLAGKGWHVRLRFRPVAGREGQGMLSEADFFRLLDEQGVDLQLIPESVFSEPARIQAHPISGSGLQ